MGLRSVEEGKRTAGSEGQYREGRTSGLKDLMGSRDDMSHHSFLSSRGNSGGP